MCFGSVTPASALRQAIENIAFPCLFLFIWLIGNLVTEKWVRPHPLVRRYGKQVQTITRRVGLPILFAGLIVYGAAVHSRDPDSWKPFAVCAAIFLIGGVAELIAKRRARRRLARQIEKACPICGYSLKENTSGVCPECGTKIAWHCPRCGAEVSRTATSCPSCRLTWSGI